MVVRLLEQILEHMSFLNYQLRLPFIICMIVCPTFKEVL